MSDPPALVSTATPQPPRLLDQVRAFAIACGFPVAVANDFVLWSRRYILVHGTRHPRDLAEGEVGQFLAHLARSEADPLPILDRVQRALQFLYGEVLCRPLGAVALPRPPRLLDQIRQVLRVRHYSPRTEDCYVQWAIRFIRFHGRRHPRDLGAAEVERFLTDLAVNGHVAASTQNQALNALVFLYKQVLEIDLGRFDAVRARRGKRLPVVLAVEEVRRVLDKIEGADGVFRLMAQLLYGCGLRVMECCTLRRVQGLTIGH